MRLAFAVWLAVAGLAPAAAQVGVAISSPGVSIGINVPTYPTLVRVPEYPVYYAPGLPTNYFFYDGLYWVFQGDGWYQSTWYNGPWYPVPPDAVPVYLLRVPVRYYRHPPAYFHGWRADAAPRWDQHWGHAWADHHRDWNRWDRAHAPAPAPLPSYQRRYAGDRYPRDASAQAREHAREYHYQPREQASRQHYEQHVQPARVQEAPRGGPDRNPHGGPQGQPHEQRAPHEREQHGRDPRGEHHEGARRDDHGSGG